MLKFYYNGIRDSGRLLQACDYSMGNLINHPFDTIAIRKREYKNFSKEVHEYFNVENETDIQSDYHETDRIYVPVDHPLYCQVLEVYKKQEAKNLKMREKWSNKKS